MDNSINQLKSKSDYRVYFRTIWFSVKVFIKRLTSFFMITDEEKSEAGTEKGRSALRRSAQPGPSGSNAQRGGQRPAPR